MLEITNLHATVAGKPILNGVSLSVPAGEVHAIMGPNGSGKSTLAYTIAGHPRYSVDSGSITLDGEDVLAMTIDERAKAGLFLAMQYPVEIPGVTVSNFLRTAKTAIDGEAPALRGWIKELKSSMEGMRMDASFAERNVNEGFSGGEKKRSATSTRETLPMTRLGASIVPSAARRRSSSTAACAAVRTSSRRWRWARAPA